MNEKLWKILFLVVGIITVLEFVFIRGMFTWMIVVALTAIVGLVNIIFSFKRQDFLQASLYALCIVALCMGYSVLL